MRKREKFSNPLDAIKTGRIEDACARYGLGRGLMRKTAADAGAIIRVGSCLLYNFTLLDQYFDALSQGGPNA